MIVSLLDNDLYKFTQQQAVLYSYPQAKVEYRFINRDVKMKFSKVSLDEIQKRILSMGEMRLTSDEYEYIKTLDFFSPMYIEYLKSFVFDPNEVKVEINNSGELSLTINGYWHHTILWEVPLMSIISYVYFHYEDTDWNYDGQDVKIYRKANELEQMSWVDFGTRRRRSFQAQNLIVEVGKKFGGFAGTSNVYLAREHKVPVVGTFAHEWVMGASALKSLQHANKEALETWMQVYSGKLGIALTDTFGTQSFFRDFTGRLAKEYDGVRHDSGCPLAFADQVIEHYKSQGIDPLSKTIVFSDGLDVGTATQIYNHCHGRIKSSFGIGTHLTNDFQKASNPTEKSKPMNMVIKLYSVNGINVVKLSDNPGKATGDKQMLAIAKHIFFNTSIFGEDNE